MAHVEVVDVDDPAVLELGEQLGLPEEPREESVAFFAELGKDYLEGRKPPED